MDNSEISIRCAVDLSYLAEAEQVEVNKVLTENEYKVDMKKTDMLRNYSAPCQNQVQSLFQVFSGGHKGERDRENR
ncbi:hypothetical protein JCM17380_34050 [Desulfosporosinus burensis]